MTHANASLPMAKPIQLNLFMPQASVFGPILGLRVWGSGFGLQGFGFWVLGSGFRVQGSGFRVQGLGFKG